ncbi:MAG: helix-turn-helix transcriptional regulator [Egibacteraceae bacterium]
MDVTLTTSADAHATRVAECPAVIGVVAVEDRMRERAVLALRGVDAVLVECVEVVGELSEALRTAACDAVVMHVPSRPDGGAVRMVRIASDTLAAVPLVVMADGGDSWVRRLLRAGAVGFVREDAVERTLVPTVQAAIAGQTAVPLDLGHHVRETSLSHRERQILGMVVLGFTNGEIAGRCYLAESTVKSHLAAAFRKLGVHSRKEAAALIMDPDGGLGTGILRMSSGEALRVEEAET